MQDVRGAAAQITSVVGQLADNVETHRTYTRRPELYGQIVKASRATFDREVVED